MKYFHLSLLCCLVAMSWQASAETLQGVFELAQQNDALIKSQAANYRAGQEQARIARAALLPQLSFNASHSEGDFDNHQSNTQYDTDTDTRSFVASQTLFDLESWHNYRSGQQASNQAEALFISDQQELVIRVVKAYTDVLAAVDQYRTSKAEEAALARQLDQTQQRFDVGLAAITDVYESQASYDNAAVNVLNARGAVGIAFEALDTITGTRIPTIAALSNAFVVQSPEPHEREAWVSKALAHNADLKASEHARSSALQNARAKRAAHLPTLTASYQKSDSETEADPSTAGVDADLNSEVLSFNLNVPLFAGGGITASRRQAWEQYNAANEQYIYAQRQTRQAARSYHLAVSTDVARVSAQQQAIRSAQSALEATQAGYEAGTRNIVDVLNAERALYNAQRLWHEARYRYINDLLQLKKVAGELDSQAIEQTNQFVMADQPILRSDFE